MMICRPFARGNQPPLGIDGLEAVPGTGGKLARQVKLLPEPTFHGVTGRLGVGVGALGFHKHCFSLLQMNWSNYVKNYLTLALGVRYNIDVLY